ncbi:MAG: YfhO family protein [Fibrobacterales bacterium]
MNNSSLTIKRFLISTSGFLILLAFLFREFIFDVSKLLVSSDQLNGLGWRWFRKGEFFISQWNDHILGGMPTIDAMFGDIYHPLSFMSSIMDPARGVGFKFIAAVLIAFICGHVLFSYFTKNWKIGGILGAAYALNPQFFSHIYPGHDGKMYIIAAMPLVVYGLLKFSRENRLWGVAVMGLTMGWMLISSHVQLTYFFLWGFFFVSVYEIFIHTKAPLKIKLSKQSLIGLSVAIGLMLGAVQLIPPYFYSTEQSVRSTEEKTTIDHATSWSLHQEEAASLILPGFIGVDTGTKAYWGHNSFKLNHETAGIVVTLLAFIGLFTKKRRKEKFFWLSLATLALTFSVGAHTPFFQFFFSFVPGVKLFRGPSMATIWWSFSIIMLAALYLKEVSEYEKAHKIGILSFCGLALALVIARFMWESAIGGLGTIVVLGGIGATIYGLAKQYSTESVSMKNIPRWVLICVSFTGIILIFIASSGTAHLSPAYFKQINTELMNSSASTIFGSFILLLVIAGGLLYLITTPFNLNRFAGILLVAVIIDTSIVNLQFIQTVPMNRYITQSSLVDAVKPRIDSLNQHRILPLGNTIKEGMVAYYGIQIPTGFHDNEVGTYRAFRGGQQLDNLLYKLRKQELATNPFLNILGVKYLTLPNQNGPQLVMNNAAFDKTTLFYNVSIVDSNSAISLLKSDSFDYQNQLMLFEKPTFQYGFTNDSGNSTLAKGSSKITAYTMDDFTISVETERPAILFINDNFHEYWNAEVNGNLTPIHRAFTTFRAVEVPSGKSTVRMYYKSKVAESSKLLIYLGITILLLLTGISYYRLKIKDPV